MMKRFSLFLPIIFLSLLMACGGKTEKMTISNISIDLLEEYPMEGSNTVIGIWNVDLGDIDPAKLKSAKLVSIRFAMGMPENSDGLEEITVQITASGASMQKVAVLNPVPQGQKELNPSVAGKQENLADLLKQGEVTLVADVNLKEDIDHELSLTAELEFEIEVKP